MIRLTNEQEIKILKRTIEKGKFLGAGVSRWVYELDQETKDEFDFPCDVVVKITMGSTAHSQSATEIAAFIEFEDKVPLATIFAYGEFVIIMEKVEVLTGGYIDTDFGREVDDEYDIDGEASWFIEEMEKYRECAINKFVLKKGYEVGNSVANWAIVEKHMEEFNKFYRENMGYDYQEYYFQDAIEILEIKVKLNEINGGTDDNMQIGFSKYQVDFVAYDYGFIPSDDFCFDNSSVLSWTLDLKDAPEYLEQLCKILSGEKIALKQLEAQFLEKKYEYRNESLLTSHDFNEPYSMNIDNRIETQRKVLLTMYKTGLYFNHGRFFNDGHYSKSENHDNRSVNLAL